MDQLGTVLSLDSLSFLLWILAWMLLYVWVSVWFSLSKALQFRSMLNILLATCLCIPSFVERNLAVLHVLFYSDYPPSVISSGSQMSLRPLEIFFHFLSLSLSLSPFHCLSLLFEAQPLSISHILFSQGKDFVPCPTPNQTRVCRLSVTFISPKVITMHHNPQFALLILFQI